MACAIFVLIFRGVEGSLFPYSGGRPKYDVEILEERIISPDGRYHVMLGIA